MDETWLIDLDGVIWRGDALIAGSDEAVSALHAANKRVVFFTNNSFPLVSSLTAKLSSMGISVSLNDILTSSMAASRCLKEKSNVLCLGGPGLYEALLNQGHRPTFAHSIVANALLDTKYKMRTHNYTENVFPKAALLEGSREGLLELVEAGIDFFAMLDDIANIEAFDACVVGIDPFFNFATLALGFRAVSQGARLIATNDDSTYPMQKGLLPGGGVLFKALQLLTGVSGEVAGKPYDPAVELVTSVVGDIAYVVGDRLDTDGLLAKHLGAKFALVYSGVTTSQQKNAKVRPCVADHDLRRVVDCILGT